MSAPPATPMDAHSVRETGYGAVGGALLHGDNPSDGAGGLQWWIRSKAGAKDQDQHGLMVHLGLPGLGAGGFYRKALISSENVHIGAQLSGGFIWAQGSLPIAIQVGDNTWLTTQPSYKWQVLPTIQLPVGMSVELDSGGKLHTELGLLFMNNWSDESVIPDVRAKFENRSGMVPYMALTYTKTIGEKPTPSGQSSEGL